MISFMQALLRHRITLWKKALPILISLLGYAILLYLSQWFYIGFDDAYNLQLPQNLVRNGEFASNAGDQFDVVVTTGPAATLPVALSFWIFGISTLSIRLITVGFFIGSLTLFYYLLYNSNSHAAHSHRFGAILMLVLSYFALTPESLIYLYNLLGQIPAIFYFLLSLILLQRYLSHGSWKILALSGFVVGLTPHTKLTMVIAIISSLIVCALLLWHQQSPTTQRFKHFIGYILSIFLPTILYLLWQLIALGKTEFVQIQIGFWNFLTYRSPTAIQLSFGDSLLRHLELLAGLGLFRLFVLGIFLSLFYFLWNAFQERSYARLNLQLFTMGYWVWWLFVDTAYEVRHLIAGIVALLFVLVWEFFNTKKDPRLCRLLAGVLIVAILFFGKQFDGATDWKQFSRYTEQQQTFANAIQTQAPKQDIFYYGWFQSPEMAFLTQQPFYRTVSDGGLSEQAQHLMIFSDVEYNIFGFYYNYYVSSRCQKPYIFDAEHNILCSVYGNPYSEEEYLAIAEKDEEICPMIESTEIGKGKCDKQLRDGFYTHYGEERTVLGKDFATWVRVKRPSSRLILEGALPPAIDEQTVRIFIDDQLKTEVSLKADQPGFSIPIHIADYRKKRFIKIRIQSDHVINPLYYQVSDPENLPQSLIFYRLYQE